MSTVRFVRKGRREVPRVPGGEIPLQAPPEIPRTVPGSLVGKLMPVVMVVAMGGMMAVMWTSGSSPLSNPMSLMFPVMMGMSMIGMFAGGNGRGAKAAEINEDRKDYLRYLTEMRKDIEQTAEAQRTSTLWSHPDPHNLWTLAGTSRMWERRASDPDYCHVRVGLGGQRLATRLVAPETGPVEELEPIAAVSLRRFVRAHSVVDQVPSAVYLRGLAAISVDGDRAAVRGLVRAMILQMCMFHGPDQLLVALVVGESHREWDWVKWLPHSQHPSIKDGVGSERMFFASIMQMLEALRDQIGVRNRFSRSSPVVPGMPQIVVIVDGGIIDVDVEDPLREAGLDSVTVLDLSGYCPRLAQSRGLQLVVQNGKLAARAGAGIEPFADADEVNVAEAQMVARRLAPYRAPLLRAGEVEDTGAGGEITSWAQMLNLGDIGSFNPDVAWKPRYDRERLRIAFGLGADGNPIELDIKESAEGGMGPHGLCIGATGSGKSEFLRTLVCGMLATHSPNQLNLVLVDFKGGATFLGLDQAPHVSAVITNLEGEAALVGRMHDALAGEMNRRQTLLATAGATSFKNVTDYESARAAGAELPPLPALFIVIDEFSEMLSQQPEFAELFVAIGRLGRSLHIHLLLASQRVDEGKMRGLETHLSYRIGLKTFSANESRTVLGVPDAYHLPGSPGAGYLKSDAEIVRFQAAYVSGKYAGGVTHRELAEGQAGAASRRQDVESRAFTAAYADFRPLDYSEAETPVVAVAVPEVAEESKVTNLEMLVDRIIGRGTPAHKIWLPPLDDAPSLDELIPRSILTGEVSGVAPLKAVIGLIDLPFYQRRDPFAVELHGAQGNVAVVGGPQSGKSTALRALIMSLALTHTPEQVQFYCLDFGGGTLTGLVGLPHVGSVAGRLDEDAVRRTVAEMTTLVRQRERSFRDAGIESITQFRQLRAVEPSSSAAAAAAHRDPFGDVFLVVDGYGSVRQDFEALDQSIITLATQGLSYGVHVVISSTRWPEVRPALKDQIGTRVELRLGDPADSDMGRKVAMQVPEGRPGRGMTWDGKNGLHTLIAMPRVDGGSDPDTLSQAVAQAVEAVNAANRWRPAPRVRMLPERLTREDLLHAAAGWVDAINHERPMMQVPIGLNEAELAPVYLNFEEHPHFMIFGDTECGKTTLLRTIVDGIMQANRADQVAIFLVDYRRTMLGVVPPEYTAAFATNAGQAKGYADSVAGVLAGRVPGTDVTQQQLRDRSWWSGPEVFLIVDDYDLVVTQAGNPLVGLVEYLAQGKDVGFHAVIARRAGGAGRALFEPMISRIRDLASPGLVMSGPKDEGALIGTVKPSLMPPGRGNLVSRAGASLIQAPWLPPL
jgi:S-DNA-T family DNA segregation ATPase FtsK/SpoIIIE